MMKTVFYNIIKMPTDNKGIIRDELNKLVSYYYKLRGWDEKGIPRE